jgi:hypothetical protein
MSSKKKFKATSKRKNPEAAPNTGKLRLFDLDNPDIDLFNYVDDELIRLAGSELLVYKYERDENFDDLYEENRIKAINPNPILVEGHYDPRMFEENLTEFGIEMTNDQLFTFNKQYIEEKIGRPLIPGDIIQPRFQNIYFDIYEVQEDSFEVYGVYHLVASARVLREAEKIFPALATGPERLNEAGEGVPNTDPPGTRTGTQFGLGDTIVLPRGAQSGARKIDHIITATNNNNDMYVVWRANKAGRETCEGVFIPYDPQTETWTVPDSGGVDMLGDASLEVLAPDEDCTKPMMVATDNNFIISWTREDKANPENSQIEAVMIEVLPGNNQIPTTKVVRTVAPGIGYFVSKTNFGDSNSNLQLVHRKINPRTGANVEDYALLLFNASISGNTPNPDNQFYIDCNGNHIDCKIKYNVYKLELMGIHFKNGVLQSVTDFNLLPNYTIPVASDKRQFSKGDKLAPSMLNTNNANELVVIHEQHDIPLPLEDGYVSRDNEIGEIKVLFLEYAGGNFEFKTDGEVSLSGWVSREALTTSGCAYRWYQRRPTSNDEARSWLNKGNSYAGLTWMELNEDNQELLPPERENFGFLNGWQFDFNAPGKPADSLSIVEDSADVTENGKEITSPRFAYNSNGGEINFNTNETWVGKEPLTFSSNAVGLYDINSNLVSRWDDMSQWVESPEKWSDPRRVHITTFSSNLKEHHNVTVWDMAYGGNRAANTLGLLQVSPIR